MVLSQHLQGQSRQVKHQVKNNELEDGPLNSAPHNVTVKFMVSYDTKWGEVLVLSGTRGLLGAGSERGLKMSCQQGPRGLVWETSVVVPDLYECQYMYTVYNEHSDKVIMKECSMHSFKLPGSVAGTSVVFSDQFLTLSNVENIYKSSAFKDVIFGCAGQMAKPLRDPAVKSAAFTTIRFRVMDYTLLPGKKVFVTGSMDELGNRKESKALALSPIGGCVWSGDLTVPTASLPISYRYFIADDAQDSVPECLVDHEAGEERLATVLREQPGNNSDQEPGPPHSTGTALSVLYLNDGHFRHKKPWRGAGLAIPVFSVRTKDSVGCGDFMDLQKMIDFVAACGMHVLQVLPVNDTQVYHTFWDSYPYSAISVFALHPLYLSLPALAKAGNGVPTGISDEINAARDKHNGIDVDYTTTIADKLRIARMIFDSPQGRADLEDSTFLSWLRNNSTWLLPYAAFCFLRDLFGSADHRLWGLLHANAHEHTRRITSPKQPFYRDILFQYWLQWHLHEQLLAASVYARAKRVVLKGDLPIGVAKCSADTWCNPKLFHMDVSVGSPPDAFDAKGQNWGFPGYNWEEMEKDGYLWWRQRLSHMSQYFTAYRVDHILAFFRIFQIPEKHVTGALGYFRPSRGLTRTGLENVGLWDVDRLCDPYITKQQLRDELGEDADEVLGKYLTQQSNSGLLAFKPEFDCERAIEEIPTPANSPDWLIAKVQKVRDVLRKLQGNVILLRDQSDPDKFYPRFDLMKTASFAECDSAKHDVLRQLHDNYFYRSNNDLWADSARKTLPVLMNATQMLMCGEDLGFVPACVPAVMHELGVIGLRIQRMPGPEAPDGQEFGRPSTYSYCTVAAPSCHDTSTLRGWYEEDEPRRERFFYHFMNGVGVVPQQCTADIVKAVVQQHLDSPSIFCILPLQDWLALRAKYYTRPAEEEAINDPTNKRHYWRWRMEPTVESLLDDKELLITIQNLNLKSGRAMLHELKE